MRIECTWESNPMFLNGGFKSIDLDFMDEVFEKSMSPIWQELIDKLSQFDFPIFEEDIYRFGSFLNELYSNKKIYDWGFSPDKDKIYIEPVPRFYGKYIKISK